MDDKQRKALKKSIEVLQKAIDDGTLQGEARAEAERNIATASGLLLSEWLPEGFVRKAIMLVLVFAGFYGLLLGHPLYLICWAITLTFSPRIMGEIALFLGKLSQRE